MLFQLSEHSSPGEWDPPRASGEGCLLKPKRTNPCAYTPPSLKGTGWRGKLSLGDVGTRGQGHQSPGDIMGTGLLEPGAQGEMGTALLDARGTWGQGWQSPGVQRRVPPSPPALGDRVAARGRGDGTRHRLVLPVPTRPEPSRDGHHVPPTGQCHRPLGGGTTGLSRGQGGVAGSRGVTFCPPAHG
uniref:Uncharacterized protein n=1 Tax=Calidris pygmaea TaxID=425635 RepID=A0A8C3JPM1_9CHAR